MELEFDNDLILSNERFGDVITAYAERAVFNIDLEPHASRDELLEFSKLTYLEEMYMGNINPDFLSMIPNGWELLTSATNKKNDYHGLAFWNKTLGHLAAAHRGTKIGSHWGSIRTDILGVFLNQQTDHMLSAITFVERLAKVLRQVNKERSAVQMSITGHSLGAWLASISTYTVRYLRWRPEARQFTTDFPTDERGLYTHTVIFDSPGSYSMLKEIQRHYDSNITRSMHIWQLDMVTYVLEENIINITDNHVGRVHLLDEGSNYSQSVISSSFLNFQSHKLANFNFQNKNEYHVMDMPQGFGEYMNHKAGGIKDRNAIQKFDTNTNDLRIFSKDEIKFLKRWKNLKEHGVKLDYSQFPIQLNSDDDPLGKFELDDKYIRCGTEELLGTVIRRTKQIIRWHGPKMMADLIDQMATSSKEILWFFEKSFKNLDTINLKFKDMPELQDYLKDKSTTLLSIKTEDIYLIAARVKNIVSQHNKSISFLTIDDLLEINKSKIDFEMAFRDQKLLVICDTSQGSTITSTFSEILKKLNDVKKILISSSFFIQSESTSLPKIELEPLSFSDLTNDCVEQILEKKIILFGNERLSLGEFLNLDIKKEMVHSLLGEKLKNFIENEEFCIKIKNTFTRLEESNALFCKVGGRVNVDSVKGLLNRAAHDKMLLVIGVNRDHHPASALAERSEGSAPGEPVAGSSAVLPDNRVVLTAMGEGEKVFRLKCCQNCDHLVYWLEATEDDSFLTLKEIYKKSFYLTRNFHNKMKVNLEKFIKKPSSDQFVFENMKGDEDVRILGGDKVQELFKDNIINRHYEKYGGRDSENVHYLKLVKSDDTAHLEWTKSSRSLEPLRHSVSPDLAQVVSELDMAREERRLVIISDEPGMGKTTTLTSISQEIAADFWTIRIDLKKYQKKIDVLPVGMDAESVVDFLLSQPLTEDQDEDFDVKRGLFEHCLKPESKRKVFLLVDGFDEIRHKDRNDSARKKVLDMLKFLLKNTSARMIVTTRMLTQMYLENELKEFATVFKKVDEKDQIEYLLDYWGTYLKVTQGTKHEREDERDNKVTKMRNWTKDMYKESGNILGRDIKEFMGIPLQLRMIADIYLKEMPQFGHSAISKFTIKSAFDLFTEFVGMKLQIYINEKMESSEIRGFEKQCVKLMNRKYHRQLGFQTFNQNYADQNLNTIAPTNYDGLIMLERLSKFGLIQLPGGGTYEFVHRTFAEFFCADLIMQWLRQEDADYRLQPMEELCLSDIFLKPQFVVIRIFINENLTVNPLSPQSHKRIGEKLYRKLNDPTTGRLIKDDDNQTALHVAVAEKKIGIVDLLMKHSRVSPDVEATTSPLIQDVHFISFLTTRDIEGGTFLFRALDTKGDLNKQKILKLVECFPIEIRKKMLMATCLGWKQLSEESEIERKFWNAKFNVQTIALDEPKILDAVSQPTKDLFGEISEIVKVHAEEFIDVIKDKSEKEIKQKFESFDKTTQHYLPLAANGNGETGINIAAEKGYKGIVELFGNEDVFTSFDIYNLTPLHCAARGGHTDVIKLLVEGLGSNTRLKFVNCRESSGQRPLALAAGMGHAAAVDYLLEVGATVNCRDSDGNTPLIKAAIPGHTEVVKVLVSRGANTTLKDNKNKTALEHAIERNHHQIVQILNTP